VVLAVEWGSGRRTGKLSNIHLGARDPATDGFVMLGKTFKGMTDEMLAWQTAGSLSSPTDPPTAACPGATGAGRGDRVRRRPVCDRSPSGMALRFARVIRYRDDKGPTEADTIDSVRTFYERD
jgi:DNA ligase-1